MVRTVTELYDSNTPQFPRLSQLVLRVSVAACGLRAHTGLGAPTHLRLPVHALTFVMTSLATTKACDSTPVGQRCTVTLHVRYVRNKMKIDTSREKWHLIHESNEKNSKGGPQKNVGLCVRPTATSHVPSSVMHMFPWGAGASMASADGRNKETYRIYEFSSLEPSSAKSTGRSTGSWVSNENK